MCYSNVHLLIFTVYRQLFQIDLEDGHNRPLFGYGEDTIYNLTIYHVVTSKDVPTDPQEVKEPSSKNLLLNPQKFMVHPSYYCMLLGDCCCTSGQESWYSSSVLGDVSSQSC